MLRLLLGAAVGRAGQAALHAICCYPFTLRVVKSFPYLG